MEFPHKPMEIQPKSVEFSHICMEISQKSTINPWEFHINPWKSTVNPWKFNRLPPKSPEFEPSPAVPPLPPTLRSRSWDLGGISVFLGMAPNPGICVQLALKHRQGKNHKMRIIAFVGSPVHDSDKDLVKLAKRLKKEKVNVDIINFGEEEANTEKLTAFITALNGKDGSGSHLVTVPPGPSLADALISSPILAGEGGAMLGLGASDFEFGVDPSADPELALVGGHGIPRIPKIRCFRHRNPIKSRISLFPHPCLDSPIPAGPGGSDVEFGVDPSADPELALALRVSMEEQRQRQEEEARRAAAASAAEAGIAAAGGDESDEALLKMTMGQPEFGRAGLPDLSSMSEEEQIAYAMQMSLQGAEFAQAEAAEVDSGAAMDTSEPAKEEDDYDVMQDPEFLQSVLENLPGVDPNNEAIRNAMGSLASQAARENRENRENRDRKDEEKK
ncbi:26S proteasome non-ATPase regulatory subunit 4 isoform 1-T1 [Acridotheres tristis]